MNKSDLLPANEDPRNPSYHFLNLENEYVENSELFISYINNNELQKVYTGTLWAEGPAYIKHLDTLVWSDIPTNRMMKLVNGTVSDIKIHLIFVMVIQITTKI